MAILYRLLYPIILYMSITFFVLVLLPSSLPLLTITVSAAAAIPCLYYFFFRDQKMRGVEPPMVFKTDIKLYYLVLLGIGACIAGNNIIILSGIGRIFTGYEAVSADLFFTPLWLQIIGMGLIVPVAEELVFRGLGFRRIRDYTGFFTAALVSALCFAVFHGNVVQGLYAGFIGYLLAYVYERYHSILAPIILHGAANLVSVALSQEMVQQYVFNSSASVIWGTAAAVFMMAVAIERIGRNTDF